MANLLNLFEFEEEDSLYDRQIKRYLADRKIILNAPITKDILESVVLYILTWNKDDKDLPTEKRKPIWIYMNSPGGNMIDGWNVIDAIANSRTPIYTVCFAECASMAFHIFIAGHKRYCFKNSILLIHDGEIEISNSSSKAKDTMKFIESLDERTKEHVLSHTNITSEFYDAIYDTEYYLFGNAEGKELGCVDYIIGEDVPMDKIL